MHDHETLSAKFGRKHSQFLAALLALPTVTDAASRVGIAPATAWRWLKEPDFQHEYQRARRDLVQHAIAQVQGATGEAVETLRKVMQDPEAPASARVSAARAVLETAQKGVEVEDVDARLKALEAHVAALRRRR